MKHRPGERIRRVIDGEDRPHGVRDRERGDGLPPRARADGAEEGRKRRGARDGFEPSPHRVEPCSVTLGEAAERERPEQPPTQRAVRLQRDERARSSGIAGRERQADDSRHHPPLGPLQAGLGQGEEGHGGVEAREGRSGPAQHHEPERLAG